MNEITLGSIRISNELVYTWLFEDVLGQYVRIYYKLHTDGRSFDFAVLDSTGYECVLPKNEDNMWHPEHGFVEIMIHGTAMFDGLRHLYWGHAQTENEGYFYYPSCDKIIETLKVLKDLETKYCPQK